MGLPGDVRSITGLKVACERDCGRTASVRVQGETDSFGSEHEDLCAECYAQDEAKDAAKRAAGTHWLQTATCDWCKKRGQGVHHARDSDEGSHGPVYLVCDPCQQSRDDQDAAAYE